MIDLNDFADIYSSIIELKSICVEFESKILKIERKITVKATPELFSKSKTKNTFGPSLSKAALMVNPVYFPSLEESAPDRT